MVAANNALKPSALRSASVRPPGNVFNLKRQFDVTGIDPSTAMLAQAKELNPECSFVLGDMRTFRLET